VQALPNWLAEMQITNLDISFCKACNIDVVSKMTSLSVLCLQVGCLGGSSYKLVGLIRECHEIEVSKVKGPTSDLS
jgi:hypothetical protein